MRLPSTRIAPAAALATLLLSGGALAAPGKTAEKREPGPVEASSDLGALMHASGPQVKARLGDPDVARAEGAGAFWTYRLPHCALFLFFHEGPKGLRVTGASTGPRKRGEPLLDVRACLASAVQLPPPDVGPEH